MAGFIESIRRHCPGGTGVLIAVNCAVFLVVTAGSLVCLITGGDFNRQMLSFLSLPSEPGLFISRPWTLMTYMFTQYSVLHLFFNMLWLWWFSGVLRFSPLNGRIIRLYICGGLCGGIFYMLFHSVFPAMSVYSTWLTGSSAAVIGIMTIAAFHSPDHEFRFFFLRVRLKWIAIISVILVLLGGSGNAGGEAAHAGGLVFGIIYGWNMRRAASRLKYRTIRDNIHVQPDTSDRLDTLLDKIRISGFGSLTSKERTELEILSRQINRQQ